VNLRRRAPAGRFRVVKMSAFAGVHNFDMLLIYFITDFCDIIIEKLERLNMEVRAKEWLNTILLSFYTASIFKRR